MSIYPTLMELAGLPIPSHVEGASIKPLLADPSAKWDRPALTTYLFNNHAVRTDKLALHPLRRRRRGALRRDGGPSGVEEPGGEPRARLDQGKVGEVHAEGERAARSDSGRGSRRLASRVGCREPLPPRLELVLLRVHLRQLLLGLLELLRVGLGGAVDSPLAALVVHRELNRRAVGARSPAATEDLDVLVPGGPTDGRRALEGAAGVQKSLRVGPPTSCAPTVKRVSSRRGEAGGGRLRRGRASARESGVAQDDDFQVIGSTCWDSARFSRPHDVSGRFESAWTGRPGRAELRRVRGGGSTPRGPPVGAEFQISAGHLRANSDNRIGRGGDGADGSFVEGMDAVRRQLQRRLRPAVHRPRVGRRRRSSGSTTATRWTSSCRRLR